MSQPVEEPVVEDKSRWSAVWLMPLVALCIAGWLGWQAWEERGVHIIIEFESGIGIAAGRTTVRYNGLEVGKVEKVAMNPDLKGVAAKVHINRELEQWLTDKTEFWLVKPEVSLAGVSGIEALLSGNYITLKPHKGKPSHHFKALGDPPPLAEGKAGLHITLNARDSGSLIAGSPVYSRDIHVGEVERVKLKSDGSSVQVDIFIDPEYQHLVHTNTRFWNVSGVHVSGPISNLNVQTGSLLSILKGGLAFSTPDGESPRAKPKEVFTLYENYEAARTGIPVTIEFPLSARIVQEGARIMFHGVEAGVIKSYSLKSDLSGFSVVASMTPQAAPALVEGAQFWLVEPRITPQGVEGLETLLSGRYIAMEITDRAIKKGVSRRLFHGSLRKPPSGPDSPGLHLTLKADDTGNLSEGSAVWMRGFDIGVIEGVELLSDGVEISVLIDPQYASLIRFGVKFWRTGGVQVSGGLSGLTIESRPLGAIISGGITCEVPDTQVKSSPVKNGETFPLYADKERAFLQGKLFRLNAGNLKSIRVGTPILYRGVAVGQVVETQLGNPANRVEIHILIQQPFIPLVTEGSRFWRVGGIDMRISALSGVEVQTPSMETLLKGGIAFATPSVEPLAEEGYSFALHENAKEEWEHWYPPLNADRDK